MRKHKIRWNYLILLGVMALFSNEFCHAQVNSINSTNASVTNLISAKTTCSPALYYREKSTFLPNKISYLSEKNGKFFLNSEGDLTLIVQNTYPIRGSPLN